MATIEETRLPAADDRLVLDWRFTELMRAGYSSEQAWELAVTRDVDIRFAERLLLDGCAPATAQRILL